MEMNITAALGSPLKTEMRGWIGRGIQSVAIDNLGHLVFTMTDAQVLDLGHVAELPGTEGNDGKVLSVSGGVIAWVESVIGLPDMAGKSGMLLTNDGTNPVWSNTVTQYASDQTALNIKGLAGQVGNFISCRDSSGTSKFAVSPAGGIGTSSGISNLTSQNNAYVNLSTAGVVASRNVDDANSALTINQINAASTGKILDLQQGGTSRAWVTYNGILYSQYVTSPSSVVYGQINTGGSVIGPNITRTVTDALAAFTVNQGSASSTGKILDLQAAGVSKASFDLSGGLTAGGSVFTATAASQVALKIKGASSQTADLVTLENPSGTVVSRIYPSGSAMFLGAVACTGCNNASSTNNSQIAFNSTGAVISRNVADANTALIICQTNTSSTGKIADFQLGVTSKASINYNGTITSASTLFVLSNSYTPATSTVAGTKGSIGWDTNYLYVCTAPNIWKRAALTTW